MSKLSNHVNQTLSSKYLLFTFSSKQKYKLGSSGTLNTDFSVLKSVFSTLKACLATLNSDFSILKSVFSVPDEPSYCFLNRLTLS